MRIKHDFGPLTFGFDIGMASVGWAVLNTTQIVDLGVRCFDKAETAKEGESLNLARRTARLTRNRLRQRAWRLTKLVRVLQKVELIADKETLYAPRPDLDNPWVLRVNGLDRKLSADEWARVIYHLCKHRGFFWQSRAEEKKAEGDAKSEGGRVKKGLADTKKRLAEKNYRSAAEMVLAEFPDAQRNKRGDYGKALSRVLLGEEFALLFERQRAFENPYATAQLELAILGSGDRKSGLFWLQKPPLSGEKLLAMVGNCTFEKSEKRAPKASFTAERHVWLTRLTNLRLIDDGRTRGLNENEWRTALILPYESPEEFKYKHLRTALEKLGVAKSFRFTGLAYPSELQKTEDKAKNPEDERLIKLPAWHELKTTLKKAGLESEWQKISTEAVEGNAEKLDSIALVLSVYKDDDDVVNELRNLDLPNKEKMIEALRDVSFDKFHSLSLKALRNILPHMERGLRYDEACIKAGYHHSQIFKLAEGDKKYLPSLYKGRDDKNRMIFNEDIGDIPRNPVVLRALNQARKVLNALVHAYGSPTSVHIEMARELSKPFEERSKIKKEQEEFRDRNQKERERFSAESGITGSPRGGDFEKWKLYHEQTSKCAYSLEEIVRGRLFEPGYVEIDHALPYSRSFDDSKNNKVLALTRENRNKGNRTPYEYLDGAGNSERWRQFVGFVESNKAYRIAKRSRLLRKDFGAEESKEFRERNLNDTRYICKFFKNQVEQFLKLHDDSEQKRCVVLSGQLTSFLRARWGLIKVRDESDRHHALDAVVIAACSHSMVKRMSDYSRRRELRQVSEGFVDVETGEIVNTAMFDKLKEHFPDPWPHFRDEVQVRLKIDDPKLLREELARFGSYSPEVINQVNGVFVSRAPQRRSGGAAHKETVYGQPERLKKEGSVTEKAALSSITLKDLDRAIDPHRNEKLYAAVRARLEAFNGKADKAFTIDNPLRKPDKSGEPTGPVVRTITLVIDKLSGVPVRNGIAKNDTMLRVDVFTKTGKFHLVPVYVHHRATGLPNRAIVAFKDEDEWTLIDESFAWRFSLYPNDLVRVVQKGKDAIIGYYGSCHRGTGSINMWSHDRSNATGKSGAIDGLGVKTAVSLEKFHVDVLGNIFPAKPEPRRGLA
jgi:CRISPR-associated endonuclease Csn1